MKTPAMVLDAVASFCTRFEQHGYNPTPLIDLGALVANADGTVDADEIDTLRQMLETMYDEQLNSELVAYLIEASLRVINDAGVEPRIRLLGEILLDCDAVEEGLIVALAIAHASEGLSASERAVVEAIAKATQTPAAKLAELEAKVRTARS